MAPAEATSANIDAPNNASVFVMFSSSVAVARLLLWNRQTDPGKVFDLELPLQDAAASYRAMDERRAIKVLLRP